MTQFDDNSINKQVDYLHRSEEENLVQTLASKYGYSYINLNDVAIDMSVMHVLPEEVARRIEMVIFAQDRKTLSVAITNPNNSEINTVLKELEGKDFIPKIFLVSSASMEYALGNYRRKGSAKAEARGVMDTDPEVISSIIKSIDSHLDVGAKITELERKDSVTSTSEIISTLFGGALALDASDIHIEQEAENVRIRYRLDGVLVDVGVLRKETTKKIVSRLKLLSGLKLNIKKEAQDGRFTFDLGEREVEVRSSVIPGGYGESVVMRLLDPNASSFKLENLGINKRLYGIIKEELGRPNGAIITTGPTGSGKTTALYSFLLSIHKPGIKILTLEDPIEYKLPGIVQTQVNEEFTFSEGLRAMLRQDPDVILVGEIRDRDVAETAMQAALTGHLVFSTLHTNNAAGSFARLMDLGVDSRTIGSACNILLGQRLVRVLCPDCKVERDITTEEQKMVQSVLGESTAIHTVFDAKGCDACGGTGYRGRVGVFEAIVMDDQVETAILSDPRESSILEAAKHQNIPTMQQDGVMKVLAGKTSFDELLRVLDISIGEQ